MRIKLGRYDVQVGVSSKGRNEERRLRILIASDVFPPMCGGSGWSSYYLAAALRERGHHVVVVRPRFGVKENRYTDYEGIPVHEFGWPEAAWKLPILTNINHNERLYPAFARYIADLIRQERIQVVHGQNGLSIPPAIMAAERTRITSVSTIRDWWALCYFGTLRHGNIPCAGCTARDLLRGLPHVAGLRGALLWPAIPYMVYNLRLKRNTLARSCRIIAVSHDAAARLQPYVEAAKVSVIPNMIDFAALAAATDRQPNPPLQGGRGLDERKTWVFIGKLEANKGAELLLPAMAQAGAKWPLVVYGEGKLRDTLERQANKYKIQLTIFPWLPNDEVLRQVQGAGGLLFPSGWPEPLSRVLLEASALGLPIVALNTGGTGDVIRDGETGLLAADLPAFSQAIARLEADAGLGQRLGENARIKARSTFSKEVVAPQVEALYREAISSPRP